MCNEPVRVIGHWWLGQKLVYIIIKTLESKLEWKKKISLWAVKVHVQCYYPGELFGYIWSSHAMLSNSFKITYTIFLLSASSRPSETDNCSTLRGRESTSQASAEEYLLVAVSHRKCDKWLCPPVGIWRRNGPEKLRLSILSTTAQQHEVQGRGERENHWDPEEPCDSLSTL